MYTFVILKILIGLKLDADVGICHLANEAVSVLAGNVRGKAQ